MANKKYCFRKDEDSHLYLIPLELSKEFDKKMTKAYKEDEFDEFNDQFDKYRKGTSVESFSFENPEEL